MEGTNALPVVRTIAPGLPVVRTIAPALPVVRTIAPALPVVRTIAATMGRIISDHLLGCCGRGWTFDPNATAAKALGGFGAGGVAGEFWKGENTEPPRV